MAVCHVQNHEGVVGDGEPKEGALVDDGGISVVYLQLSGEEFLRQPVEVLATESSQLLVDGLEVGQLLVARGGDSIRRASLMSSGEVEGHVH